MSDSPDALAVPLVQRRAVSTPGHVRAVKRRIAAAVLPLLPPETLGDVRLLPHQRRAVTRLHRIIDQHHGALLADAVGLGKTFTALAVARRYTQAVVLAPAGLVPMWQAALLRTGQQLSVHSLHRASSRPLESFADMPSGPHARVLVIVDEAHALRNTATARYRNVARAVANCDVLLLSATPLHNRPVELDAIFALFRGSGDRMPSRDLLATLIVRRERLPTAAAPNTESAEGANTANIRTAAPPRLRVHKPHTIRQNAETLERLLALPAPLPARDGAVAGALVRMGLLRAWCSSDAALTQALARRLQRGAAMRDALEAGRHPSADELKSWIMGDDAGADTQLGFPELLVAHQLDEREQQAPLLALLRGHCDALRALRDHHVLHARADEVRAAYLRRLRLRHAGRPVVAFSQHARTVQALFRALSDIAGVGMLTSRQGRIASGTLSRTELLECFAPRAHGRPPPPGSQRVTMLLATDLIAEGVNLQDAAVVVHLDLPWTHALRTQRTGRVVRLGSSHQVVHEYQLRAMPSARRVLRAESRIARKARLGARLVGRGSDWSPADRQTAWLEQLESWLTTGEDIALATRRGHTATIAGDVGLRAAIVCAHSTVGTHVLAVVRRDHGRLWVSDRADALLAVSHGRWPSRCRCQQSAAADNARTRTLAASAIRHAVYRWLARERIRAALGVSQTASGALSQSALHSVLQPASPSLRSRSQQRALAWLHAIVASWSTVRRSQLQAAVSEARHCIVSASGVGCEAALRGWTEQSGHPESLVNAWRQYPELVCAVANSPGGWAIPEAAAEPTRVRISACLRVGSHEAAS